MMLLNPKSCFEAEHRKLKLDISDTKPTKYYACEDWKCLSRRLSRRCSNYIRMYNDTVICSCGKTLKEIGIEDSHAEDGVFTTNKISFLISDDLRLVPNLAVPTMQTLRDLGITDIDGAELRDVTFGFHEIMELLKGSLLSLTPLTDIILVKAAQKNLAAEAKSEPGILFNYNEKEATSFGNSKKISLRLMVRSSTNKFLFAQCEEDFIDFLFSSLTIPLGRVEYLLGGKTCLWNIDNLYRSVEIINEDKYLRTPGTKVRITNPKLPYGYMTKNKIIPLIEAAVLYYHKDSSLQKEWLLYYKDVKVVKSVTPFLEEPAGDYVKGPMMYMVTDDLTVTPSCMISSLSMLNKLKVSSSDVKEVEVHIGLEEGLSILKASLTSTSALTDGLKIDRMLMKQPKQEH